MTIKEITALRKAGKLKEALYCAQVEFENNDNEFTAGALFWCLNDWARQQVGEEAERTIGRMEALYSECCDEDEVMQRAIDTARRRIQPHYAELKEALGRAKRGENVEADYYRFAAIFKAGELGPILHPDFGWLIFYALKQTPSEKIHLRKTMLGTYLELCLPRPELLHSLILGEAVKIEQNSPMQFRIRDFARLWGLENLREEDWEQFQTDDGKTLPSLVEKLVGVYAKELKTDGAEAPEDFSRLVDKALITYPKSQNMPYFKAIVLISQGKKAEALDYYKNLILRFPAKFYLWSHAAELVEDADTKAGLLCRALTCGAEDEFLGGVRLRLAEVLVHNGLTANAKRELENVRTLYQSKGWRLKPEFRQLNGRLTGVAPAEDNRKLYAELAVKADEFIYSALPTVLAVKVTETQADDRNRPGRKVTAWVLRTENSTLRLWKPAKFGLNIRTANGPAFDVKVQDGKIVWIKPHSGAVSVPWLKVHGGTAHLRTDRNGRKYTLTDGSYVGDSLLRGISEGQEIRILSALQKDGRWSAIAIL